MMLRGQTTLYSEMMSKCKYTKVTAPVSDQECLLNVVLHGSALVDKDFSCRLVGSSCRVIVDLSGEN